MNIITVEVDVEKQKVLKVKTDGLDPITSASVLAGVTSGLLAGVKLETVNKNKIVGSKNKVVPVSKIIKPGKQV